MGWRAKKSGFYSQQGEEISLLHSFHATLGPTRTSVQWVLVVALTPGARFDHSPPSAAEVKNM